MITEPKGLYVHIPYCVRKCGYCDFCSLGGSSGVPDEYIDALLREAGRYGEGGIEVNTVFIGGGTPSLLSPTQLKRLVGELRKVFRFSSDTEFTVECNPGASQAEFFRACLECGVNRISFGLQSIHENELKKLGRIHTYDEFIKALRDAKEVGFDNISVDLMYGIPEQTKESFAKTLSEVVALPVDHISVYGLIIEEGTRFFHEQSTLPLPDEDAECDMYYFAHDFLSSMGFSHYEISNYAKVGRESKHNLKYWRLDEYLGLGASAHSYLGGRRYFNTANVKDYIAGAGGEMQLHEECDEESEYIMLRLRLSEGLPLSDFENRFGKEFLLGREDTVRKYQAYGLIGIEDGRLFLSAQGLYLSNSILSELI